MDIKKPRNVRGMYILVNFMDIKKPRNFRGMHMAARAHNVFWLVEILKIFVLETTKPIELWLCRNDHWVVLY